MNVAKLKLDRADHAPSVRIRSRRYGVKIAVVVAVIVALVVFSGARLTAVPQVNTALVTLAYRSQNYTVLNATGYVVAQRKAAVSSKATGRIVWLGVVEGTEVKKDEVIARLESEDVAAAYAHTKANIRVARADLQQGLAEFHDAEANMKRSRELLTKHFISPAAYDTVAARYNKAQAAVDSLRAGVSAAQANARIAGVAVEQTVLRAPFDGVVLSKHANVGDNVTPYSSAQDTKGAVVTIADMQTLEVEADVSETNLASIFVSQPCEIQLEAFPNLRLAAEVSRIVPMVDRAKATVLVKLRFLKPDPRVLPDMSVKVAFLSKPVSSMDRQAVMSVPSQAVVSRSGQSMVFVVKGDKVDALPVQRGGKIGALVEVKGVAAGDRVVLNPSADLSDGQHVVQLES